VLVSVIESFKFSIELLNSFNVKLTFVHEQASLNFSLEFIWEFALATGEISLNFLGLLLEIGCLNDSLPNHVRLNGLGDQSLDKIVENTLHEFQSTNIQEWQHAVAEHEMAVVNLSLLSKANQ